MDAAAPSPTEKSRPAGSDGSADDATWPEIDFEAREHVHAVVDASGTSFLQAMKILPEERREAMFAIYAFCREIDDIADDNAAPAEKIARLKHWRTQIDKLFEGKPEFVTARALVRPVAAYGLDRADFMSLIDGMEMDAVENIRAPSLNKLELYCDRVAAAVGRLSVRAFGAPEPAARDVASRLGQALQLTNILRDLVEDAEMGRIYLPAELLDAQGITSRDPKTVLEHPQIGAVCGAVAKLAREYFAEARVALKRCRRKPMRPAVMMMEAYRCLLDRLEKRGWKNLDQPVAVPKWRKIWIAVRYGLF
ncbi:MAG: presqualene diphosphate synthase HpnD [Alphaproteobacteria bacterium]